MTLELRPLRYLLALAEHGGLGRAAKALGMTQPALTRSLKGLERQVGADLFVRSKAGISPTDEGRLLVERARRLVQVADELERDLLATRGPGSEQVAVGAGQFPAEMLLPDAIARFLSVRPLARLRVVVRDWDELVQRLRAHELDFFVGETSTLEGEHDVDIEPLAPHPLYLVGRRGHPLTHRGRVGMADALGYPLAALSRIPPRTLQPLIRSRRDVGTRAARPFPAIEFSNLGAVKRVIAKCDAIATLPLAFVAREVKGGALALLGSEPWLYLHYGIVTLKGATTSPGALALRSLVLEEELALVREEARVAARFAQKPKAGRRRR